MWKVTGRFGAIIRANLGQKVSGSMCRESDGSQWDELKRNKLWGEVTNWSACVVLKSPFFKALLFTGHIWHFQLFFESNLTYE